MKIPSDFEKWYERVTKDTKDRYGCLAEAHLLAGYSADEGELMLTAWAVEFDQFGGRTVTGDHVGSYEWPDPRVTLTASDVVSALQLKYPIELDPDADD